MYATQLSISGEDAPSVAGIEYPPGEQMRFPFSDTPVLAYGGVVPVIITFTAPPAKGTKVELAISYQPCDETACLPPATKAATVIV